MACAKFSHGQIVATPGVRDSVSLVALSHALSRHLLGDWGEVCDEDRIANDRAVQNGGRLLSAYRDGDVTFWIITEAEPRASTTFLLPDEY